MTEQPPEKNQPSSDRLINTMVVIATTLIMILIIEGILHLVMPVNTTPPIPGFFRPDPVLGKALEPDGEWRHITTEFDVTILTDKNGHRAASNKSPKRNNDPAVTIIGDSMTFGWGVQWHDSMGSILEAKLKQTNESSYILNTSVPGFGIEHYLRVGRQVLNQSSKQKHLILALFGRNDFKRWTKLDPQSFVDGRILPKNWEKRSAVRNFLAKNSAIYYLLYLATRPEPSTPKIYSDWTDDTKHLFMKHVSEVLELCQDLERTGIRTNILMVPSKLETASHYWSSTGKPVPTEALTRWRRELSTQAKHAGYTVLDPLESFKAQEAQSPGSLFIKIGSHLTPMDNEFLASWIYDQLLATAAQ
jgi:hypothetical protein